METTPGTSNSSRPSLSRRLVQWLFLGKTLRRGLIALAGLFTLIAAFYTIENWRGKRAWESYQGYLAAHNLPTDWTPPKPLNIPPDQNFAETPLLKSIGYRGRGTTNAELKLRIGALFRTRFVDYLGGLAKMTDLAACQQELRGMTNITPPPLPSDPALDVVDYLRPLEPEMNELRQASLRPQSAFIIQGDDPMTIDEPNFVTARILSQLFLLHASAELALGKPAEAFRDQWVIYRLAEAMKSSDTMVATMVRMAILGVNTQLFWEGWARAQWTESQWRAFQTQYHDTDLLADLDRSFRMHEIGAINHILNNFSGAELAKTFSRKALGMFWFDKRAEKFFPLEWLIRVAPRGWVRQNQVVYNQLMALSTLDCFDVSQQRVFPGKQADNQRKLEAAMNQVTPFNLIAGIVIPHWVNVAQLAARNQTMAKLAELVCALERYRLKNGSYPETLQMLTPDFIEKLPHDLITGEPFKYRRPADGQFLLYSVGWNEQDDGGVIAINPQGQWAADQGDWGWPAKPSKL